ncbi:MAG: U32 family peptidase [Ruminococcus sp.]|jgi:putative protease|nr:U32 family peptidase [Ruminococcus sp.]
MIEILSPGGSFEAVKAGVNAGAGAVYVGLERFSARAFAKNFTAETLPSVCGYCHERGVKVYLAVNTLIHQADLADIAALSELPVDAFIVQDLGAVGVLKDKTLHASTQMTVHTKSGIDFCKSVGIKRVVLARELSKAEIAGLAAYAKSIGIETEVFVYGALCFAVSGQCYMSAFFGGGKRSANMGSCAGACRLPFSTGKFNPNARALSLKDQNLAPYIKELEAMGVTSLKIEGRMKGSDYVTRAINTLKTGKREKNMTDGYFTGNLNDCFGKRDNQT